ncbi:MAG: cytochrome b N-terminal domain-containing protein [Armatimonadota bacterium]|nr:cytochrome b N-terminal domain-containing protein [Armatimonadota bacterium]MDR7402414.1 cytochrome b N-terminal domain-containing protein [Armatimonadota bacterium]MDR7404246.1 cytochrome b N-terminal domain-containing protein [Armatimonadota bacterium]MDR7437565.1 cytochrome b N-terminal domain-containing protein [Armatimonadota bacterium]MDR7472159.1 cytochrome b N-terminal domain-containing protein [Armatimonadota bacterium]
MWETVRDWLRERREKLDLFDETLVARQGNPFYLLGPMLYYFWLITVVTGVVLMLWYEPTTTGAYSSIERIQNEIGRTGLTVFGRPVVLGGLIRGLHKYGADALITVIFLRLYRMYFLGEYKKPGELSWMLAFAGLILAMISGITGYLLIWNQRAFWAAKVVLTVPVYFDEIPVLGQLKFGSMIAYLFLGGPAIGQATITRFYAIHFGISLVLLVLVEVLFFRTRRKRINMSLTPLAVFLVMLVVISLLLPAESGRRADPTRTPLPILSDWYFLALYQYVKYTPPLWAGLGPGLLIGFGMLVPFLDRSRGRRPLERPFFFVVGVLALTYFLVFTALILFNIAVIERDPFIIMLVTLAVLSLGLAWEIRYRRRRAAAPAAPARAPARG